MRYPIRISTYWKPLFSVMGLSPSRSYVELVGDRVEFHFGGLRGEALLADVVDVREHRWPFYYGLGAKYGPGDAVSFVGSTEGVIKIELSEPQPFSIWGPFSRKKSGSVIVSLEQPDAFIAAIREAKPRPSPPPEARVIR